MAKNAGMRGLPYWCVLLVGLGVGCAHRAAGPDAGFGLRPGDLLFQDLDGSPLCDAIETVTTGYHDTRVSHIALVVETKPEVKVVEAIGPGVIETPLGKFLGRSHDAEGRPKVMVGRLGDEYRPLIPEAITYARAQVGKPYDKPFVMREDAFYCSELMYFAFEHANGERPVFVTAPMTFKDPGTHQFFPAWVEYYRELGMPIPEGEPGLNPGGISREGSVEIVYWYGELARK